MDQTELSEFPAAALGRTQGYGKSNTSDTVFPEFSGVGVPKKLENGKRVCADVTHFESNIKKMAVNSKRNGLLL